MQSVMETKRAELADLCHRFHVRTLDVFGSAVREDFEPSSSDLDFLVEFDPISPAQYADAYFALKEEFEALFGRPVDLVTSVSVANPYFRASLAASSERVYAT
jgi:hypothetical protein